MIQKDVCDTWLNEKYGKKTVNDIGTTFSVKQKKILKKSVFIHAQENTKKELWLG